MNDKAFQYVMTIATYGNLTAAAKALYITQPALSMHLRELENQLGLKLFTRSGRKMELTYAGEEFVRSAKKICMMRYELEDRMNEIRINSEGRLRIGYTIKQMPVHFPKVYCRFHQKWPNVRVYPLDGHLEELEQLLENGKLDIAFGNLLIPHPEFVYTPIHKDRLLMVLSETHPACAYAQILPNLPYPWLDMKYLKETCIILQHTNQSIRQMEEDAMLYADFKPQETFKISSIDAGIHMAAEGMGAAFTMQSYITALPENAALFCVGDPDRVETFSAITRSNTEEENCIRDWIKTAQELE